MTKIKPFSVEGGIFYPLDHLNLICYTEGMTITPEQSNKLATKDDVKVIVEGKPEQI